MMKLNDELNIGEICEVAGRKVKAGVYANKNAEYIFFDGEIIKNVGIGTYVLIKKGFANIIGIVDGEYMKDPNFEDYSFSKEVKRLVSIDILGIMKKDNFVAGLSDLPSIGNNVYVSTPEIINSIITNGNKNCITIGKLIDNHDYPYLIDIQKLICSHIGIFGNTGSGKSNTLAKIYYELIEKYKNNTEFVDNSRFCFFDFNGEYINVFDTAKHYEFSIDNSGDDNKFCLKITDISNAEFWSMVFNATEKTQKPFIKRSINYFDKLITKKKKISTTMLSEMIINLNVYYIDCKYYIKDIFDILGRSDMYQKVEDKLFVNGKFNNQYLYRDGNKPEFRITKEIFENDVFGEIVTFDIDEIDSFKMLELALLINYCKEIGKNYISKEHIGPMMSRVQGRVEALSHLFYISKENNINTNVEIFHLNNLKPEYKKIVPMIICKKIYEEKKKNKEERIKKSLHLIIDEAHNILSSDSARESEEWKDYRLETFEEIIKEGRKFSTFLTISSQRPSDISDTIISQLHNYFIHRLVNEEDLRKIRKAVSFIDSKTNDMIPILPSGGCIFSGMATNFPMLIQVEMVPKNRRPASETIDIDERWGDTIQSIINKM